MSDYKVKITQELLDVINEKGIEIPVPDKEIEDIKNANSTFNIIKYVEDELLVSDYFLIELLKNKYSKESLEKELTSWFINEYFPKFNYSVSKMVEKAIDAENFEKPVPSLNIQDMIKHINKNYGLTIGDKKTLEETLMTFSYYKVMGYRSVFLDTFANERDKWTGNFDKRMNSDDLVTLVNFDIQLKDILLKYISKAELRLKSRSAFFLADYFDKKNQGHGAYFYFDEENFSNKESWIRVMNESLGEVLTNGATNPYIKHYKKKYSSRLPVWILFKELSFGGYGYFMSKLRKDVKKEIYSDVFDTSICGLSLSDITSGEKNEVDVKLLDYLIDMIRLVRNRCAHNLRIYDFKMGGKKTPQFNDVFYNSEDNTKISIGGFIRLLEFVLLESEYESLLIEVKELSKDLNAMPKEEGYSYGRFEERILQEMDFIKFNLN